MAGVYGTATAVEPWTDRRRRAQDLEERYPFAAELLRLYGALLEVQEQAFHAARATRPPERTLARYIAERVLAEVIDVTVAQGPPRLREAATERSRSEDREALVARWLKGDDQPAVDRYLARASSAPVLEALHEEATWAERGPRDGRHCPACGGLPQLAYFSPSGDDLVTAPRRLLCSRCGHAWVFQRLTCAGCGETSGARLVIYSETERFPHLRVDGCESCRQYLLTIDVRKDPSAVPVVDELAALPLDLYAQERGLTKIVPNLMEI